MLQRVLLNTSPTSILYMMLHHTTPLYANYQPQKNLEHRLYCPTARASSSVDSSLSGPNDMGKSCSRVMTVYLPSLSYINMGVLGYNIRSAKRTVQEVSRECQDPLTSQNSRINCLHMPQGLAGGEMLVATAMARKSPALAPW